MTHYIEVMRIVGVGANKKAIPTGKGAGWDTVEVTKAEFEKCRELAVPFEKAAYLLDLWVDDEMLDTIAIDKSGYQLLLGVSYPRK